MRSLSAIAVFLPESKRRSHDPPRTQARQHAQTFGARSGRPCASLPSRTSTAARLFIVDLLRVRLRTYGPDNPFHGEYAKRVGGIQAGDEVVRGGERIAATGRRFPPQTQRGHVAAVLRECLAGCECGGAGAGGDEGCGARGIRGRASAARHDSVGIAVVFGSGSAMGGKISAAVMSGFGPWFRLGGRRRIRRGENRS